MNTKTYTINTDKENVIRRFKESFSSKLMLGEPRTIGSIFGSFLFIRRLFGEKVFCKWDILIYLEAVCKLSQDEEGNTKLSYKILRGYNNPIKILMWYAVIFIPLFMTIASKNMLSTTSPFVLYVVPAIPIMILVILTNIYSRLPGRADENIAILEEEILYEVERINKYPQYNVKTNDLKKIDFKKEN